MKIKQQRFITSTAAVLMVCLLVSGYFAVAQSGSSDDPLVTQSYLDAVITPKAMQTVENAANAQANTLSARINELSQKLNESITAAAAAVASDETFLKRVSAAGGGTAADSGTWQSLTLSAGQKVYLAAGAEVVLRSGAATCVESGGRGLVNLSEVGELSEGETLDLYALYTATTQSAGLQASERTKVLISGDYSVA